MLNLSALLLAALASTQNPPAALPQGAPPEVAPRTTGDVRTTTAPDPEVEAWAAVLIARLADRNPDIARSAEVGLIALGEKAVPSVTRIASSGSPEGVRAAQRVLDHIRRGPPRPFPGGDGPLGRGPDGPPNGRPLPNGPRTGDEPLPPFGPGLRGPRRHDGADGEGPRPPFPPRDGRGRRENGPGANGPGTDDGSTERPLPPPGGPRGQGPREGGPQHPPRDGTGQGNGQGRGPEPRGDKPLNDNPNQPPHRDGPN